VLYAFYNNRQFIDDLIEKLCKKFYCSHETVARALHTPEGNNRLSLQERLQDLCLNKESYRRHKKFFNQQLNYLITQEANLEFTL